MSSVHHPRRAGACARAAAHAARQRVRARPPPRLADAVRARGRGRARARRDRDGRRRQRVRASSRRSTSRSAASRWSCSSFIDVERFRRFEWPLYLGTIGLVAVVFLLGFSTRGSRRWIQFPFFQFQPSELGKLTLLLALAALIARNAGRIGTLRFVVICIAYAALPTGLVFVEPDFGTALVYFASLLCVLFVAGVRLRHLALLGGVAVLLGGGRAVGAPGRRRAGAQAVPGGSPHLVPAPRPQHAQRGLQPVAGQDRRGRRGSRRARQVGRDADAQRLPARAPHRLRVRRAGRGARIRRRDAPARPLPRRALAHPARDRGRALALRAPDLRGRVRLAAGVGLHQRRA